MRFCQNILRSAYKFKDATGVPLQIGVHTGPIAVGDGVVNIEDIVNAIL
ncbi:hypothetical protein H8D57_03985 [bacterium]|nr:hypothetical protein [bacterium]